MWLKNITIFHKTPNGYERYNLEASIRNTSYLNKNKTGVSNSDNAVIRIFDVKHYNDGWCCQKGDVIVAKQVFDSISKAPLTELSERYGKEYVFTVTSVDEFVFNDEDINEISHIKIGAK